MYNKLLSDEDERGYLAQMAATKLLELQKQEPKLVKSGIPVSQIEVQGYDARYTQLDLLTCLNQGTSLSSTDIGRLAFVKHNTVFRKWILDPKSSAIHIDGNADVGPANYTSMTSFLCAETAHLMESVKRTLVLSYFCGLRAAPTSKIWPGVKDMMTSLLGQILQGLEEGVFDDEFLDESLKDDIKDHDLDGLYRVFESLVMLLPESWTVVCFIDGIEFYETQRRVDRTLGIIKRLLKLCKRVKKSQAPTFKLLVTAAKTSLIVGKEFRPENRIVCSEDPIEDSILPANILTSDILRSY